MGKFYWLIAGSGLDTEVTFEPEKSDLIYDLVKGQKMSFPKA